MIHFIITGGTFDKQYDEIRGELTFKSSHLPEIIKSSRCTIPVTFEINQLTDSLYIDDTGRQSILESCKETPASRIIITHGTDTMTETASLIGRNLEGKTVVLTGAMIPYSVAGSDALFNLGTAVTAVQLLHEGCYICMNGKTFRWDRVAKDKERGIFVEC